MLSGLIKSPANKGSEKSSETITAIVWVFIFFMTRG